MSQYTPSKGQCFYVRFNPRQKVVMGEMFGADKVITVQDQSYRDVIFRCVATDDTCVVCTRVYGSFSDGKPQLFARADVTFSPVGPDVMQALNIDFNEQAE